MNIDVLLDACLARRNNEDQSIERFRKLVNYASEYGVEVTRIELSKPSFTHLLDVLPPLVAFAYKDGGLEFLRGIDCDDKDKFDSVSNTWAPDTRFKYVCGLWVPSTGATLTYQHQVNADHSEALKLSVLPKAYLLPR